MATFIETAKMDMLEKKCSEKRVNQQSNSKYSIQLLVNK